MRAGVHRAMMFGDDALGGFLPCGGRASGGYTRFRRGGIRRYGRRGDGGGERGPAGPADGARRARRPPRRHGVGRPRPHRLRPQGSDRRLRAGILLARRPRLPDGPLRQRDRVAARTARRGGDFPPARRRIGREPVRTRAAGPDRRRPQAGHGSSVPAHGRRQRIHRSSVHRCQLRRRPDGAERRHLHRGDARRRRSMANRWPECASGRPSTSSWWTFRRATGAGKLLPEISDGAPEPPGIGRPARADLQLPHVLQRGSGKPGAVCQAGGLRSGALRAAGQVDRRAHRTPKAQRAAAGHAAVHRPHSQRQGRHQQQRRFLHRLHRRQAGTTRTPAYARARGDLAGAQGVHAGAVLFPGARPAGARAAARGDEPLGAVQGRIHRHGQLAATSFTSAKRGAWWANT